MKKKTFRGRRLEVLEEIREWVNQEVDDYSSVDIVLELIQEEFNN